MKSGTPLVIPDGLSLKPFQEECAYRMIRFLKKYGGVYNACEMRLGKTIQTLAAINSLYDEFVNAALRSPVIFIICPATLRLVWKKEIEKWGYAGLEHPAGYDRWCTPAVKIITSSKDLRTSPYIYNVISYDLAKTPEFIAYTKERKLDFLILDESHFCCNQKSKRTKAIMKNIWPKAYFKICLSGTPYKNSVVEAYTLFHALAPDLFPDFWAFANTYSNRKHNGFAVVFEGLKNAADLRKKIDERFFIRKRLKQVLPEMPDKQYIDVPLDKEYAVKLTEEEKEALKQYHMELQALLERDTPMEKIKPPSSAILKIRREQGLKKVEPITDYVKNILEQNVSIVLVCIFRDVIKAYEESFAEYKPAIIHGGFNAAKKQSELERFQQAKTPIIIVQAAVGSLGLDLSISSDIVLCDITYSFSDLLQVCARADHVEKTQSVSIHVPIVEGSSDLKVVKRIMEKVVNFNTVMQ